MTQSRKTLGELLKNKNSSIPNVENLKDNEASAWLMTPTRVGGLVRLDSKDSDLKEDGLKKEVPSLDIIKDFSNEFSNQNFYNNSRNNSFTSALNENTKNYFDATKQQSLTKDFKSGEENYINKTNSVIFKNRNNPNSEVFKDKGSSLGSDYSKITFTLVETEAGKKVNLELTTEKKVKKSQQII